MPLQRTTTMAYPVISTPGTSNAPITTMATTTTNSAPTTIGVGSSKSRSSEGNNNQRLVHTHHDSSSSSFVFNPHAASASSFASSSAPAGPGLSSPAPYPTTTTTTHTTATPTDDTPMPIDKSSTVTRAIPAPLSSSALLSPSRNIQNYNKFGFGGMVRVVYREDVNSNANAGGCAYKESAMGDMARSKSEPLPEDVEYGISVDTDVDMGDDTGESQSSTGSVETVTPRQAQQQQLWRSQSEYDARTSSYVPLHHALGMIHNSNNNNNNNNTPQNATPAVPQPTISSASSAATLLSQQRQGQKTQTQDDAMEDVLSSDEYSDDGRGTVTNATTNGDDDDDYGIDNNMDDITPSQQRDWALLLSQHPDPPLAPKTRTPSIGHGGQGQGPALDRRSIYIAPPLKTNSNSGSDAMATTAAPTPTKTQAQPQPTTSTLTTTTSSATVIPRSTPCAAQPTSTPTTSLLLPSSLEPQPQSQPTTQGQQIQPSPSKGTTSTGVGLGPAPSRVPTPPIQQSQPAPLGRKASMAATEILDPEVQDIVKDLKEMGVKVRDYAYVPRARRRKGEVNDTEKEREKGKEGGDEQENTTRALSEKAKGKQKAVEPASTKMSKSPTKTDTKSPSSSTTVITLPLASNPNTHLNLPVPKLPLEIFDPYKSVSEVDYRWSLPTARRQAQGPSAAIPGKVLHHLLEIGWLSRSEMWARASEDDLKNLERYLEGIERWREVLRSGSVKGPGNDEEEGEEEVLSIHAFYPQPYPWVSLPFNCIPSLEQRRDLLNARRGFWTHTDEMREASEINERREKRDRRAGRETRRRAGMRERAAGTGRGEDVSAVKGVQGQRGESSQGARDASVERGIKRRAEEDDERVPSPPGERQRSVSVNGRKRRKMSPEPEMVSDCEDGSGDEGDDETPKASQAQDGDESSPKKGTTRTRKQVEKRDKTPESETPEQPPKNRYINPFQGLENIVHIHPSSDVNQSSVPASQNTNVGGAPDDDEDEDLYKGLTEEERKYQIELDEEEAEYQKRLRASLREMVRDCAGVDGEDGVRRRWWEFEMSELRRGGVGRNGIVRRRVGEPPRHMYSFEQRAEEDDDEEEEKERRRRETKIRTNALLNPYAGDKEDEVDPKTFTYKQYFKKPERFTGGPYTVYQPPQAQQKAPQTEGNGAPEDISPSTLQKWVAGVRQAQKGAGVQVQGMEMSPFVQFPAGAMGIGSLLGGGEGRPSPMPLERTDTPPLSEAEQAANEAFANGRRGLMPPPNGRPNATLNGVNGNGNVSTATPGRGRGLTRSYTNEGMPGGQYAGRGDMPVWGVAPSPTPRSNTPVQAQASATPLKRQAKPLGKTTTLASIPVDSNASFRVPVTRSMAGREVPGVQSANGNEKVKETVVVGDDSAQDDGADTESEGGDTEAED